MYLNNEGAGLFRGVHQLRYDLLAFFRNGQARFFTLALPVAFLLTFATVFSDKTGRCEIHGLVEGTRKMPRLLFPFIITGALRLVAMTRPYRCPRCGASTTRA